MGYEEERLALVEDLRRRGIIKSDKVYRAMLKVPRHLFIPPGHSRRSAYIDSPLSIGHGQTISAPHMNAMMCEALELKEGDKVLEVGTGSGYHAALVAEIIGPTGEVYTIERIKELAERAQKVLQELGYSNVHVIHGDGSLGYPEKAPYDKILVTAASPSIIEDLIDQLSPNNGILVIPVGTKSWGQDLYVVKKKGDSIKKKRICGVVFVPLIGKKGFHE